MSEKQGPPLHLPETNVRGEHGYLEIPTIYVGKQPKPGNNPKGGGFRVPPTRPGGMGSGITHNEGLRRETLDNIFATEKSEKNGYETKSRNLQALTEAELANVRVQYPAAGTTTAQAYQHELNVRNILTQQKTAELYTQTALANAFYGDSPLNKTTGEYLVKAKSLERIVKPFGPVYSSWVKSYKAAYSAKLLTEQIQLLNNQHIHVQNLLGVAHAQEQRQQAADQEARRIAAEQARLAAEQQAQRVAAEEARIKAEAEAREQARLAALAEAERLAAELARIAAEAAAEAAARYIAAEQARVEAEDEVQRQAEQLRFERQQEEEQAREHRRQQAHLEEQAEHARLKAQWQAETEARWESPTFANAGSMAAFGPTFTGTLGNFGTSPATSFALRTALRAAVSAAIAALATAATPVMVGFAALFAPSRLGNGDLFSVSVPLSELAPDSTADLYELAATGGEIDLPVRLGSRTIGNRVEIVVVATDGVSVPASVPVRLAHFDARKNAYVSGSTVSNGPVITWTPLVEPQDPSTEFPLIDTDLPIYEGATVTPDTGRIDPFPELDRYGFGGFITIFPIDSGIPPTFTMFRDRRQDPGIASGAGQSVSGNWLGAASTGEGAPIPIQIADKFRGREFSSFKAFRRVFWKAVANDEFLIDQFTPFNKFDIRNGLSPSAHSSEQVGGRKKFEIHHVTPISEGGSVYDIDNLRILTPKQHIETHSKKGEI